MSNLPHVLRTSVVAQEDALQQGLERVEWLKREIIAEEARNACRVLALEAAKEKLEKVLETY